MGIEIVGIGIGVGIGIDVGIFSCPLSLVQYIFVQPKFPFLQKQLLQKLSPVSLPCQPLFTTSPPDNLQFLPVWESMDVSEDFIELKD